MIYIYLYVSNMQLIEVMIYFCLQELNLNVMNTYLVYGVGECKTQHAHADDLVNLGYAVETTSPRSIQLLIAQ